VPSLHDLHVGLDQITFSWVRVIWILELEQPLSHSLLLGVNAVQEKVAELFEVVLRED